MFIVLGKLKIPFEPSRVRIKSEQGIAVEIVASAALTAIRRGRIAGGPESSIGRRIVSARDPCRCASDFPRVGFPAFMARLAGTRNGVEAPFAFAACSIVSINESANPIFAAGNADEHEILDHQGRKRDAVALA